MSSTTVAFASVPPGAFQRRLADGQLQTVHITKTVQWQTTPFSVGLYQAYRDALGITADPELEIWDDVWKPGPLFSDANVHGNDVPVVGVSYNDALGAVAWLSRRDGRAYRLPTEAEFEYAVRAKCSCTAACDFSSVPHRKHTGRAWPEAFLSCWNASAKTANPHGIHGLNGVLWHWCSDWYAPYPDAPDTTDPHGPETEPTSTLWKGRTLPAGRVIRGGSYSYPEWYGRCDNRHFSFSDDRNVNLGFRVVFDAA
ncbi:formylglycine-generating enzyme family protein [Streptomyces sp. GbtcB6]|uniref:formylglycine-generating enzyme family protein n=1 Tax=Streptomyces sp. GbtcB6 TaxID=2824751 RepID=UPI001C30FF62|nr:formylglycine-generating enzyme family protein [Streptomyces sp. GbtcB6]